MGKYQNDAQELLKQIGGRENIGAVSHCITRMRFVLNDASKADIKKIESIKSVKGTFTQAGQFQVIIGNDVAEFYNDFVAIAGVEGVSKDAVKKAATSNQNVLQRILTAIAEIFAPLIPAIIVGGLILGFRNCIDSIYMFENGTKTLVEVSQFWAGVDHFLWLIGEAVFHLGIPVGICWSVTKKMGTTQMLGVVLGLTLVSSQLLNAYAVAGTAAAEIPKWNFDFIKVNMIGYQAQVIPAILAAFTLVYLEKFFRKITPQVVSMIVVPFCSLLLSVMAAHFILGPIGWKIGSGISAVVYAGITGPARVLFGAIFGFVYAPLVITGLHHMSNAIDLQLIADFGGTMLWPMIAISNIAQGSAVLGMIALQKKNVEAQEVNVPSTISCYLGVTEPAMFGVNLKYVFPFFCGMIGSSIAAILCTATGVTANAIGVGGLPGILSIQPKYMFPFALCMIIAVAVPFFLTYVIGSRKLDAAARNGEEREEMEEVVVETVEKKEEVMKAVVSGRAATLASLEDGVFSAGMMGEGMAILPSEGKVVAPSAGKVSVLMEESRHAVGLILDNGAEMLIHVGLDTVNMKGEGFAYHVTEGERVEQGQLLLTFDIEKIKAAGHPTDVVVVISGKPEGWNHTLVTEGDVVAGETVVI